jgi:hypothetical protein
MTCPHLREVTVVFCSACPIRKQVPVDRITTASRCTAEGFRECPLYREALARLQGALAEDGPVTVTQGNQGLHAEGGTR